MDKHRCKICSRRFSNGKAMGGHMRSHLAKLPIPPKIPYQAQEQLIESTLTPSSSSSHAKQQHQHKSLSLNNFKSINSDPSTVHDRESDSESSPKNSTRRRSRRTRKFITSESPAVEPELTASSVCEEDVAMSLIMLSRDKWSKRGNLVMQDDTETEENSTENDDEDEDDGALFNVRKRSRAIYKCETCKKVFKSYQALGGHRASHKKIRTRFQDDEQTEWSIHHGGGGNGGYDRKGDYTNRRIFECPFCYKVFASGQALGGHKKVHFSSNNAAANARTKSSTTSSAKFRDNWIDLNLPAPEEDEDSTVSNAGIFFSIK